MDLTGNCFSATGSTLLAYLSGLVARAKDIRLKRDTLQEAADHAASGTSWKPHCVAVFVLEASSIVVLPCSPKGAFPWLHALRVDQRADYNSRHTRESASMNVLAMLRDMRSSM